MGGEACIGGTGIHRLQRAEKSNRKLSPHTGRRGGRRGDCNPGSRFRGLWSLQPYSVQSQQVPGERQPRPGEPLEQEVRGETPGFSLPLSFHFAIAPPLGQTQPEAATHGRL